MRCSGTRPLLITCIGPVFHAKEDGDAVDVRMESCHLRVARGRVPLIGYA